MIICHSNVDDTITSCLVRVLLIQYMYTALTSNDADNKILMRPSHSGGSRPSDKGGGGGNHPDPGIWGHSKNNFSGPYRPLFGLKIR